MQNSIYDTAPEAPVTPLTINIKGRLLNFTRPWVMGIVNVTPDSFYEGSRTECLRDVRLRVRSMREAGAQCVDIGGYSSRPGADDVSADEEYRRLATGLEAVRLEWPDAVVSIDTFRAGVARRCVEEWGADIINDISGGTLDPAMGETVASLRVAYVLMHMRGTPADMQSHTHYNDVVADVIADLAFKADTLRSLGVADIIIDPGFGFAKTVEQNYRLLACLGEFRRLGCPILAGLSRKSMIWRPLGITPTASLPGTIALDTVALMHGADIVRVHDVAEAVQTVSVLQLLRDSETTI
ncbi:MAG: dihydropteroate synthase [Muribaculaceae bacterium]|nr:dihydropteroate synthase [Bacteroides sp.]MDE6680004.1 dihydropteroate synthase [Muribaculaceae bacterium]MDE6843744.1 dihydropteroate synthase [Muribaculaceae bacterium]MDE7189768.1 dihydropteroate synthase [Muribaculaceae bacterium]